MFALSLTTMPPIQAFAPSIAILPKTPSPTFLSQRRPSSASLPRRPSLSMCASSDEPASFLDSLQLLLDPTLSPGARATLFQDVAKRAPAATRDAVSSACAAAGLDAVDDVLTQVSDDVLPDLARSGPRAAADAVRSLPRVGAAAVGVVRGGAPGAGKDLLGVFAAEVLNAFKAVPDGVEEVRFEVESFGSGYEVRRYPALEVVSVGIEGVGDDAADIGEVEAAAGLGGAFAALAGFLLGGNSAGKVLKTLTPFFVTLGEGGVARTLSVVLCDVEGGAPEAVGAAGGKVYFERRPGGVYGVTKFGGLATGGAIRRARSALLERIDEEDVCESEGLAGCTVALYNGPGTVAFVRRNEVLVRYADGDGQESGRNESQIYVGGTYEDVSDMTD